MPAPITPIRLPLAAAIRVSRPAAQHGVLASREQWRGENRRAGCTPDKRRAARTNWRNRPDFCRFVAIAGQKAEVLVMATAAPARFPATTLDEAPLSAASSRGITPARLTEAVSALRLAQRRYSREKQPNEWAMLQNNLG